MKTPIHTLTGVLAGLATLATTAAMLSVPTTTASAAPQAPTTQPTIQPSAQLARSGAQQWVAAHAGALRRAPEDVLVRTATHAGDNGTFAIAYERTHAGLPVVGGDFVVVIDRSGQVLASSVAQDRAVDLASTVPAVGADAAAAVATARVEDASSVGTPRLVVWQRDSTRLAWETEVRGTVAGEASWQLVYVDAADGSLLESREQIAHGSGTAAYSGPNPLSFATTGSGGSYSMTDPGATTLKCQDAATNVTFSGPDDNWGNGNATNRETGCVDGFYAAQQMKQMMSSWLGRNGMTGSGGWVPLRVGLNQVNAYYDGSQVQIGHNQQNQWISSLDVIAHEYGHGVDDKTPGGISQAGTQEFVGDVFGALTEFYDNQPAAYDGPDWTVGEEINLTGQGPIRDMANPAAVGDPACYTSSIPSTEVHAAAGPGNHWFYLLAQGGTSRCDSTPVTGIGVQQAGTILYNAMLMKTSASSYLKYRTWTLQAAKNIDSTCAQFNAVKLAWDAVNVPAQSADPTCGGTTPPPTGGNLLANPGFESGAVDWTGTAGPVTNDAGRPARTGTWKLWLGGNGRTSTETISQTVTIPATATAATLSYWLRTDTAETGSSAYDRMRVQVVDGSSTSTLRTFSNAGASTTYTQFSHDLLAYKGRTVTVRFLLNEDSSLQTSFVVDDTALTVS